MNGDQTLPKAPPTPQGGSLLRRFVIIALVILIGVIVLAELGVLRAASSKYTSTTDSRYDSEWSGRRGLLRSARLTPTVEVTTTGAGRSIADEAAKAIRENAGTAAGGNGTAAIRITGVSPSGAAWIPFFKSGSCQFTATYIVDAAGVGSRIHVEGTITGKVELSMKGLCSTRSFRADMGKLLASAIIGEIQQMMAKH